MRKCCLESAPARRSMIDCREQGSKNLFLRYTLPQLAQLLGPSCQVYSTVQHSTVLMVRSVPSFRVVPLSPSSLSIFPLHLPSCCSGIPAQFYSICLLLLGPFLLLLLQLQLQLQLLLRPTLICCLLCVCVCVQYVRVSFWLASLAPVHLPFPISRPSSPPSIVSCYPLTPTLTPTSTSILYLHPSLHPCFQVWLQNVGRVEDPAAITAAHATRLLWTVPLRFNKKIKSHSPEQCSHGRPVFHLVTF